MMKRIAGTILAGALTVSMVTGCSQSPSQSGGTAGDTPQAADTSGESASQDAAGKGNGPDYSGVKLVYWSNWESTEPQGMVIQEAVKEYEKETGIKIDLEFKGRKGIKEGLIPALDADQQVDLFDGQGNKGNYGDRTISLEDLVKEHDYEKRTNPALMGLARGYTDGVLKEIPYQFKANAYLYNKALFQKAGIEKVPDTWEDFMAACQKLKDAGITPVTVDDAYAPQAFGMHLARLLGTKGVKAVVDNGGWDEPEVLKTAKCFEDMAAKGYFSGQVAANVWPTGQNTEFATGKAAMYCSGTYVPNEVKNITGDSFEWGFFNYPKVDGGINSQEAMVVGAQSFAITSKCKNPEAAFGLIEKLTRGKYDAKLAAETLGLPADLENTEWPAQLADVKPYFDNCTEIFDTSGGAENNPDIIPALKENLMNLYGGKLTAEQFVSNMMAASK